MQSGRNRPLKPSFPYREPDNVTRDNHIGRAEGCCKRYKAGGGLPLLPTPNAHCLQSHVLRPGTGGGRTAASHHCRGRTATPRPPSGTASQAAARRRPGTSSAHSQLRSPRSASGRRAACPEPWVGRSVDGWSRVDLAAPSRAGGLVPRPRQRKRPPMAHRKPAAGAQTCEKVSKPTVAQARVDRRAGSWRACMGGCWERLTYSTAFVVCASSSDNSRDDVALLPPTARRRAARLNSEQGQRRLLRRGSRWCSAPSALLQRHAVAGSKRGCSINRYRWQLHDGCTAARVEAWPTRV